MGEQPVDRHDHQADGRYRGDAYDDQFRFLLLSAAPAGASGGPPARGQAPGHRVVPIVEKSIGYDTDG
ncbi:hypothetical protein GCM10010358_75480 [Streptomyces minutiscleroticus]|uniref:Uncharacterized protein n=1 Tax=Streptomyces minutiscleroticus TaxID=68238 RepID=A0A918P179_9ACTN|nr:hypothetical protein GCM10010358_75480 [Streptomyces minutiscleroticus]